MIASETVIWPSCKLSGRWQTLETRSARTESTPGCTMQKKSPRWVLYQTSDCLVVHAGREAQPPLIRPHAWKQALVAPYCNALVRCHPVRYSNSAAYLQNLSPRTAHRKSRRSSAVLPLTGAEYPAIPVRVGTHKIIGV